MILCILFGYFGRGDQLCGLFILQVWGVGTNKEKLYLGINVINVVIYNYYCYIIIVNKKF